MKKVGICTVYTGYNYGSALQAFATKNILKQLGYNGEILKVSGSIVKGRDIRLRKMLVLGWNMLTHPKYAKGLVRIYAGDKNKILSQNSQIKFNEFYEKEINPTIVAQSRLKAVAKSEEFLSFICGSDQVWNATTFYVDPFYYLTFAPKGKRIAFAPSFGRDFIPDYNLKTISKRVSNIPYLSVRETGGQKIIRDITGREAEVLIDPTLVIDKEKWIKLLKLEQKEQKERYALAYFLDTPSAKAKKVIEELAESEYKILSLPYCREGDLYGTCLDAGPKEFLQILLNADVICTDSFHGTAFSINFGKEFYCFEREYGQAANQSSRVVSLLKKVGFSERYNSEKLCLSKSIDYDYCNTVLQNEREKVNAYLLNALRETATNRGDNLNGK